MYVPFPFKSYKHTIKSLNQFLQADVIELASAFDFTFISLEYDMKHDEIVYGPIKVLISKDSESQNKLTIGSKGDIVFILLCALKSKGFEIKTDLIYNPLIPQVIHTDEGEIIIEDCTFEKLYEIIEKQIKIDFKDVDANKILDIPLIVYEVDSLDKL